MPSSQDYRRRKKQAVVDLYGGCCVCCGETQLEFLTIDHIDGQGAQQRREQAPGKKTRPSGGVNFYNYLLRLPERDPNSQVLCWNCNCTKHQYGRCPHEAALTSLIGAGILYLEDRNNPLQLPSRGAIG